VSLLAATTVILAVRNPPPADGEASLANAALTPSAGQTGGSADPQVAPGEVILELKGNIIPVHQTQVSPKVGGMITELCIKEGDKIQQGKPLAKLETTDYEAEWHQAVAQTKAARSRWEELTKYRDLEIEQAKAELDESATQRDQLYLDWKRSANLRGAALAAKDYEAAESAYRAMEARVKRLQLAFQMMKGPGRRDAQIDATKADWKQAQATEAKAKWRLDNCTVTAPISGTILTKRAEIGSIVNPAALNIAASLCDMANLAEMEVDIAVPERDLPRVLPAERDTSRALWLRQRCVIKPEAFPKRLYQGYVSRVMPTADRGKAAVPVRVFILIPAEEEGVYLRPDMSAVVTFYNSRVEVKE
jgi:multidrug efflux pump subunit AcrA (membrane-fusion protein)